MITAGSIKRPLPVRPIDGARVTVPTAALLPAVQAAGTKHTMFIPAPSPVEDTMASALQATAFQRMLDRMGIDAVEALDSRGL